MKLLIWNYKLQIQICWKLSNQADSYSPILSLVKIVQLAGCDFPKDWLDLPIRKSYFLTIQMSQNNRFVTFSSQGIASGIVMLHGYFFRKQTIAAYENIYYTTSKLWVANISKKSRTKKSRNNRSRFSTLAMDNWNTARKKMIFFNYSIHNSITKIIKMKFNFPLEYCSWMTKKLSLKFYKFLGKNLYSLCWILHLGDGGYLR